MASMGERKQTLREIILDLPITEVDYYPGDVDDLLRFDYEVEENATDEIDIRNNKGLILITRVGFNKWYVRSRKAGFDPTICTGVDCVQELIGDETKIISVNHVTRQPL